MPPKFGVRRHRVKALIYERPPLTATEDVCRPRASDILAKPAMVNRAAEQMLHVSNANHDQRSSSAACVIRQRADVAVNTLSNLLVVDDSSSMAVAKDVHDFVESKPLANVGVNVSTNNVCQKSIDVVNHLSNNLVHSVTAKSEPRTCDDVCLPKDAVVKSEKDKPATLCKKEPRKKKGHRARSSSSDSEGDKPKRYSVIRLPKYDGMSIPFMTFKAQFNNAAAYNKWSDSDQLAQLKACSTSTAANVMWDSDPTDVEDLPRLWQTLADRFGGYDLTEKYRTEVRARVRKPNESLSTLYADIKSCQLWGTQAQLLRLRRQL